MTASVAVIIPSLNSPIIDRVIDAIGAQAGAADLADIVVVGKDAPGLLAPGGPARLLDTGDPVPPGTARNLGIAATSADLLIFLDSDCLPQPGWLAGHLAAHAAGHAVVSGGVLADGDGYWHRSYNLAMFHEIFADNPPGPRDLLPTLNLSVERRVIDAVGGLDAALRRGQDMEWTTRMRRAGFQPYFWPQAAVRHAHDRHTLRAVWRDCARSGFYSRQIRLRHSDLVPAPFFLRRRRLTLLLAPAIALATTARIVAQRRGVFRRQWTTVGALFVTKLAWAWGASRAQEPQ